MQGIMWVEKYRPKTLSDIIGQKAIKGSLEAFIKNPKEMPHMLFTGSAGVGKTTMALCIINTLLGEHVKDYSLELNASDERGINMVREKVKKFSRLAGTKKTPFKIIILDEADEMTSSAQTALRRTIEDTAESCRFIMIANNPSKIILPLQSRCAGFKFSLINKKDVIERLEYIAKSENVEFDIEGLNAIYVQSNGDVRRAINMLQVSASFGAITKENIKLSAGLSKLSDVDQVLEDALAGRVIESIENTTDLIKLYGMSEADFFKYFNESIHTSNPDKIAEILEIVSKYDCRICEGATPEIQIPAMLVEIGEI